MSVKTTFAVGDVVISRKIGIRESFRGVVKEVVIRFVKPKPSPIYQIYYHVEDEDGRLWHRDDRDLRSAIEGTQHATAAA